MRLDTPFGVEPLDLGESIWSEAPEKPIEAYKRFCFIFSYEEVFLPESGSSSSSSIDWRLRRPISF